MEPEVEYEIRINDWYFASVSGHQTGARKEALHYVAMALADEPDAQVTILEVTRKAVPEEDYNGW